MEYLKGKTVGWVFTGSFCTIDTVLPEMEKMKQTGARVVPIFSQHVAALDTRFNPASAVREKAECICGESVIDSIPGAEPIGPQKKLDLIVVAPCTGNTLAKLANAITDTTATMAVKAHLRNQRPVVIALATNDALAGNAKNLGLLLNAKHYYFVPFGQDGAQTKENSMQAHFPSIVKTAELALQGKQLQPLLLGAGECLNP